MWQQQAFETFARKRMNFSRPNVGWTLGFAELFKQFLCGISVNLYILPCNNVVIQLVQCAMFVFFVNFSCNDSVFIFYLFFFFLQCYGIQSSPMLTLNPTLKKRQPKGNTHQNKTTLTTEENKSRAITS